MIEAILTDIEGTTTSISFVHDSLFPYAKKRLRDFLARRGGEPAVRRELAEVSKLEGRELAVDEAATVLERWIAEDRKLTPLKALQGLIWAEGYAAGELKGHVYPDTAPALREWYGKGLALYVYSSGSVEAQKLIFGHSIDGDLTPLFSGYFDTRIGAKREAAAYAAIAREIGRQPDRILFLSDIGEELDAARAAGLQTWQLVRDAAAKPFPAHRQACDLTQVHP